MAILCRKTWIFLAAFVLGAASPACAQFDFSYDGGESVWSLSNGVITARFRLTPAGMFHFEELTDHQSGAVWSKAPGALSSPIRLQVDNRFYDAQTNFRLVGQGSQPIARQGQQQTIVLADLENTGQIILELEMFAGQPVLRYRVRFVNLRPATVRVRGADMLPWNLDDSGTGFRAFRVNQWVDAGRLGNFEPIESALAAGGREIRVESGAHGQHCGWLAVRDAADRGLFFGWEFDGRASATARHLASSRSLQFSASVNALSRPLRQNEEFGVPPAFIGSFQGDWDEAGYRTQRFAEAAIAQPIPDENFPYVIWDSWKYQFDMDENMLRRNAEIAASIGIEVFVLDLGWAAHIGEWRADPRKFPGGLRALSDYVHSLGMKFGLHFALAEAAPESAVLRSNPDWTSSVNENYFDARSLCLSHQPVKEWLIAETLRMIDDYGVDWILQDGENMVKRCNKRTHTHDPEDSNYSNAVDGLNAVISAVQAERPAALWENCEDGGNMMTFNMLRHYVTSIAADDTGPMTTRQAVYGITWPLPPRYSDRYMPDEELHPYTTRSYMFGGPWIFMNKLDRVTPEDLEFARSEIRLFKALRSRIRDGKVFHLTARPVEERIDALQSYHPPSDTSVVFAYRPSSGQESELLIPRGLNPDTMYRVNFTEEPRPAITATGRQLMDEGFEVHLPGMWSTEIVHITPSAGLEPLPEENPPVVPPPAPGENPDPGEIPNPAPGENPNPGSGENPVPGETPNPGPGENPAPGENPDPGSGENPAPGEIPNPGSGENPVPGETPNPAPVENPAPGENPSPDFGGNPNPEPGGTPAPEVNPNPATPGPPEENPGTEIPSPGEGPRPDPATGEYPAPEAEPPF